MRSLAALMLCLLFVLPGHAEGVSARDVVQAYPFNRATAGLATFYDCKQRGQCSASQITASGQKFNPHKMACAHREYRMGTQLRVTLGSRSAVCVVNDRGPAKWTGNTIDLTPAMATAIGLRGKARVTIERI